MREPYMWRTANISWRMCVVVKQIQSNPIIGLNNGSSSIRCKAIIWTNAGLLLIEWLGTNVSEIWMFVDQSCRLQNSGHFSRPHCVECLGFSSHRNRTHKNDMMTSSNGNIFHVTGPLCGEFTGHRWIPLTKASDVELWCFLWSTPE